MALACWSIMARFVFKLGGVLRQRLHEEQQRQRELAERQALLNELQQALKQLDQRVRLANDDVRDHHLVGALDMGYLAAHRRFLAAMQRGAVELAQRMALAHRQVQEAHAALAEAAKRRKAIEKLRERQFQRWRADQDRRETVELDELSMQIAYHHLVEEGES